MSMRALWFMLFVMAPLATLAGYGSTYGIGSGGGGVTVGNAVSGGTASRLLHSDASGLVSTATPALGAGLALNPGPLTVSSCDPTTTGDADGCSVVDMAATAASGDKARVTRFNGTTVHSIDRDGNQVNAGTLGVAGQLTITKDPASTSSDDAALLVAPATSASNELLVAVRDNTTSRFTVDKEGDVTVGLTLTVGSNISGTNITGSGNISGTNITGSGNLTTGGLVNSSVLGVLPIGDYIGGTYSTGTTLSGDANDYALSTNSVYGHRLSGGAADRNITGMTPITTPGSRLISVPFCNVGTTNSLVFKNEDAASTAANRIITPGGTDYTLPFGACTWFHYDGGSSRWRLQP